MEGHHSTVDASVHPSIPGQLQMMQVQLPPGQKPTDPQGLTPAPHVPRVAVPMQMNCHQMQVPISGAYGQRETLTYRAPPVNYIQQHPQSQLACHPVGKPYYGQPMYHSQQMLVNQPVPHVSPPVGQRQSLYFRPGRISGGVYSEMQGPSHPWGDYRVRMDYMPAYGASQQCGNPQVYVGPVPVDQRMVEFGSPVRVSSLEAQRFGSPTPGYAAGHGYYHTHVQQYQPYMAAAKSNSTVWHSMDHPMQQTMDQQHGKQALLSTNIPDVGFPLHPNAMSSPVSVNLSQNYIPGKRLEHFSPNMQGCGAAMMSPSRQGAECVDEFSGTKPQPSMIHGSGQAVEFPNRQCVMYGQMLSPGGQFRQGVPAQLQVMQGQTMDVGGMHQGPNVYGSNVYHPQMFGDAQHQRCNYVCPQQLQSPQFCPAVNPKCEPDVIGQCCNQETGALTRSSLLQGQVFRCNKAEQDHLLQTSESGGLTCHPVSSHQVSDVSPAAAGNSTDAVLGDFTGISARGPNSVLSPSLEAIAGSSAQTKSLDSQNVDTDISDESFISQTTTAMLVNGLSTSSSTVDPRLMKSSPVMSASAISNTSALSNNLASAEETKKSDVGRNFSTNVVTRVATSLSLAGELRHPLSCTSVVTQMVSTSTTAAMTVSIAACVSQHCVLTTASRNVLEASQKETVVLSNPIPPEDPQTNSLISLTKNEKNLNTVPKNISDCVMSTPSSIADLDVQEVKTEPAFPFHRRRVARGAKKKKVPTATLR